jgi:hypothetical protein
MVIIVERDADAAGVAAQLDVIEALRASTRRLRTYIEDTPWVEVRWPNPRYL